MENNILYIQKIIQYRKKETITQNIARKRAPMTCQIWNCSEIAADIKSELKEKHDKEYPARLMEIITVGNDSASESYVKGKKKDCKEIGFSYRHLQFASDATTEDILKAISFSRANGIILQLPVPKHIDVKRIVEAIGPKRDIDGFHPQNLGELMLGNYNDNDGNDKTADNKDGGDALLIPCTPAGVMEVLKYHDIDLSGKKVCIIGRSNIVGKPLDVMMINAGATVTSCNSKTKDLANITKQSDIVVSTVGKANFVTKDMIKDGAIVIDVGINRGEDGKMCGDVCEDVREVAFAVTPVPGGIGLMTRAMLMKNLYQCDATSIVPTTFRPVRIELNCEIDENIVRTPAEQEMLDKYCGGKIWINKDFAAQ